MSEKFSLALGESVIVKPNVQDPDLGWEIGGWQGRISDIDPDNDLICIDCDSLTLKNMPASMIARCQAEGLDWDQICLAPTEVELATARDTPEDVAEIKAQLERQHHSPAEKHEAVIPPLPDRIEVVTGAHAMMLQEIRSWGLFSLILGGLHLFTSGFLNAPWGILLLAVGLASFYFRQAAMFVIYGVTLAWAAISNLMSGQSGWIIFALFQLFLAFQLFRKFFQFRQFQAEYTMLQAQEAAPNPVIPERAVRIFPWAGCSLGALSLIGMVVFFVGAIVLVSTTAEATEISGYLDLMAGLVIDLGVLGLAIGLASILSGYPNKVVAWLGVITSAVVLLLELALVLLG